ncbi:MAG: hypothetical protein ACRCZ0_11885 [Cetobacterium sp.]
MKKRIILCALVDSEGHLKYMVDKFKPNDSLCVSNYSIGKIGLETLFYNIELSITDDLIKETCWTKKEILRRLEESQQTKMKVFTRIQDFYKEADEFQFAYKEKLEEWDEELDTQKLRTFCSDFKREILGESNGTKFFRYIKN